ncbi:MAG: J domain-containing protein [Lachnospiraceae bacterium]|nr:J domain-containing protein [Lachnospiraceae bacterium]MDD3616594.1 J domain-containing protein [Lachnospiraceae bacterium]
MTISEAQRLLGVEETDEMKTVKWKFRKLMVQYHPDAVHSDHPEYIKKAQLLNEAYALLRKTHLSPKVKSSKKKNQNQKAKRQTAQEQTTQRHDTMSWKGKKLEQAFVERTIFQSHGLWEDNSLDFYEVACGKYEWNPDLEEFPCFLHSIHLAVVQLLEKVESQQNIYSSEAIKEKRYVYQMQLFYLLASQYIAPLYCLNKLAEPEQKDEQDRNVYRFAASLVISRKDRRVYKLEPGQMLFLSSLKNNRIMVADADGTQLGYLSFAEDYLYYILIPILRNRRAQGKCVIRKKEPGRGRMAEPKINIDFYLRMEASAEEINSSNQNLQIAEILSRYSTMLASDM